MKKEYSQQDVERILKSDAQIPESVDRRIQETYRELGLIKNTGRQSTRRRIVHRKKRKVWAAVAAAAVLTAGLGVTVVATVNLLSTEVVETENGINYELYVAKETREAHKISVTPTYMPEGYVYHETGPYQHKWHNDATDGGITIVSYNAAKLYQMQKTSGMLLSDFSRDELDEDLSAQLQIPGIQASLIDRNNVYDSYTDEKETHRTLNLFNSEYGYLIQIFEMDGDLPLEEIYKIAQGLDIQVLDETVPYPSDDELAALRDGIIEKQEQTKFNLEVPEVSIYKVGDVLECQGGYPIGYQYQVQDIRITDTLPEEEFPKQYFTVNYDEDLAPLLNKEGSLKPHERYASIYGEEDKIETGNSKFVILKMVVKNTSANDAVFAAPSISFIQEDNTGALRRISGHKSASEDYENLTAYGRPIWQNPAVTNDEDFWYTTSINSGQETEYTLVYIVDEDCIDNAYFAFFDGGMYQLEDGTLVTEPYVKVTE